MFSILNVQDLFMVPMMIDRLIVSMDNQVTLVVSSLQISKFDLSFDPSKPNKVIIGAKSHRHLWAERRRKEEPIAHNSILFTLLNDPPLPTTRLANCLRVSDAYRQLNNFCFVNLHPGENPTPPFIVQIGAETTHDDTGLNYHGKFRINDLLEKMTDCLKRQKKSLKNGPALVFEIFSSEEQFEIDYFPASLAK